MDWNFSLFVMWLDYYNHEHLTAVSTAWCNCRRHSIHLHCLQTVKNKKKMFHQALTWSRLCTVVRLQKIDIHCLENDLINYFTCAVIKQDESEVGNDMLLVSEIVFNLNIMNVNVKTTALVAGSLLMLERSNELVL